MLIKLCWRFLLIVLQVKHDLHWSEQEETPDLCCCRSFVTFLFSEQEDGPVTEQNILPGGSERFLLRGWCQRKIHILNWLNKENSSCRRWHVCQQVLLLDFNPELHNLTAEPRTRIWIWRVSWWWFRTWRTSCLLEPLYWWKTYFLSDYQFWQEFMKGTTRTGFSLVFGSDPMKMLFVTSSWSISLMMEDINQQN